MNEQLLLRLPHRQFVFTNRSGRCTDIPKVLRAFFCHDKRLHGEISCLVYGLVQSNSDFCFYLTSRYQMRYIAAVGSIFVGKFLEAKSRTCFDTNSSCVPDLLTLKSAKNL